MAGHPPSGTVTFMLTDLEGSTRSWEADPEAMTAAMARHDELLEKTIATHGGYVFARMGDGMAASFSTARDAVCAAAAFQLALGAQRWDTERPLRARVGLHTDEATVIDDEGYANLPVNRCSRLMTAAHGGQTVVSGATEILMRAQLPTGLALVDLGEHRLRDLGSPTRIFQLVREGDKEQFPPLRTLDAFPGNLPAQVSSFVGRRRDVSRVADALERSRVVTVTGVGGVGKTRLALQVAADVVPRYRDGAWLVELAPLRDPDDVIGAVAGAFRSTSRSGLSLEQSLLEMLKDKRLLLVLDNCEHLLGVVARLVARIERHCPGVVVLATSREGLALDGEQLIALPPMESGGPDDDLQALVATDAVSLFVERARNVKADFSLSENNSRAVVEICQRLDGVPLAIELAAARVIALGPTELARRLDRRFQLLAGGRRGAVERHATLRAAIDWSFELLSLQEQRLLARLAVFAGGCTLDAIETVCAGHSIASEDVMDLITSLVARSLVIAEEGKTGTRFRLLETIRQYAEEKLADSGETTTLLVRHARFYADLSERAADHFYGPEQLIWAKQVNTESDNIRNALAAAIADSNAEIAVRLVANAPHHHGYGGTGEVFEIPAARMVIDLPQAREQIGYPRVLIAAAWHAYLRGDYDDAQQLRHRALENAPARAEERRRPRVELDDCNLVAMASLAAGDYVTAIASYDRGAEIAVADGYPGLAAIALAVGVNTALLGGGDVEEMIAKAEHALALARDSGMHAAIVIALNSLALTLAESDPTQARALLDESIRRSATPEESSPSGVLTACLAASRLADWDLTLALAERSMRLERWIMAPLQVAPCLAVCARAFAETQPETAGVLHGAAHAAFKRAASETAGHQRFASLGPNANFVLAALHEAGGIVASRLGDDAARELRLNGKAMSMSDAISFALDNIGRLSGRLASSP